MYERPAQGVGIAYNNSLNQYGPDAPTKSPHGLRESAWTYMAIAALSNDWYAADCIVINNPKGMYVREKEWVLLLNPADVAAEARLHLHYGDGSTLEHVVKVGARRLKAVLVDEFGKANAHFGFRCTSDRPIAVQCARSFHWFEREEMMTYWSVPCVPGPLR